MLKRCPGWRMPPAFHHGRSALDVVVAVVLMMIGQERVVVLRLFVAVKKRCSRSIVATMWLACSTSTAFPQPLGFSNDWKSTIESYQMLTSDSCPKLSHIERSCANLGFPSTMNEET